MPWASQSRVFCWYWCFLFVITINFLAQLLGKLTVGGILDCTCSGSRGHRCLPSCSPIHLPSFVSRVPISRNVTNVSILMINLSGTYVGFSIPTINTRHRFPSSSCTASTSKTRPVDGAHGARLGKISCRLPPVLRRAQLILFYDGLFSSVPCCPSRNWRAC